MQPQYVGIDLGAETVKLVTLEEQGGKLAVTQRLVVEHGKQPQAAVRDLLWRIDRSRIRGIAATGRLQRLLHVEGVPTKAALRRGVRAVHSELGGVTVISVGAHGFSVLELRVDGEEWFQQNSRCSQGTGNFLAQLVQRFGLSVEEASELCDRVAQPAPLSGRCPVILKTDMTHLANKGEDKARILAGLYDAVCENVLTLVRPRLSPRDVVLVGGVSRSERVRRNVAAWLSARGLSLVAPKPEDSHLEAIGAAVHASEHPFAIGELPNTEALFAVTEADRLEVVPPLRDARSRVHRRPKVHLKGAFAEPREVYLGFDIGSTGSKVVAIDAGSSEPVWEAYVNTEGAPVHAAQRLVEQWVQQVGERGSVLGAGVTGSGREVVGSLLTTCYGRKRVFVMNEIAAHARGASFIDPEVDTIFEIGGQDAKYIRLDGGRVIDAAMNEACSAGTGSFIAEQGAKFEGVGEDVARLGELALQADHGISLGQHCSVFMAEVIDEAIAQGVARDAIIAGLYDSIIQNYLNRVKGSRSVGQRIFCQGMPFSSDALAAAVTRQTGRDVVVPPNPGTIGAFGIALLAREELGIEDGERKLLDPTVFLGARVVSKETFLCKSTKGCGGSGNHCRIDKLKTQVNGVLQRFIWGGNCSLYDKGGGRAKLPDLAPDPFRAREELLDAIVAAQKGPEGRPVVAMTDEFTLKSLAPLFVVFLSRLGFEPRMARGAGARALHKGIEGARVPFCAPAQLYHGVVFDLAEGKPDYLLLPMLQELPRVGEEQHSVLCPIVQASPDLVGGLLDDGRKVLRPVIRFDMGGLRGQELRASMRSLARALGAEARFEAALGDAIRAQEEFDASCTKIGQDALDFCADKGVVPIAVLGRPYTIHNDVLNSNVPTILRSLGAIAIPIDCLPVPGDVPVYDDQYWAYTQRNLRAAEIVRRTPGLYSVFCSNYACGPDSFTLHFYAYIMRGKPFAVVETDGHSGDAGTKTRMEAFLFCVDSDLRSHASEQNAATDFVELSGRGVNMAEVKATNAVLLIPRMGEGAEVAAAALRAEGYRAEALAMSNRDDVRTGRKHTSGKECVPMILTAGTLLNRIEQGPKDERYVLFMPTASGPCRFGVYNTLHKIILDDTGWSDRVKIVSPDDGDYFREMSPDFSVRLFAGFCGADMLEAMRNDVRPIERRRGAANEIHARYSAELHERMEEARNGTGLGAVKEVFGGLWGVRDILRRAGREFAAIRGDASGVPTVAVVGEIYVRLDPFANDFVVDKLEERGVRVRFAPFIEWLEYTSHLAEERVIDERTRRDDQPLSIIVSGVVQRAILESVYQICADALGWGARTTIRQTLSGADGYIDKALIGEAALTLGGPVHEFKEGLIQGVVVVGPHECMPCKVAEAQFGKVAEDMNLPYLSVPLNGDPLDTEALDRFAYDLHEAHARGAGERFSSVTGKHKPTAHAAAPARSATPLVPLRRSKDGAPVDQARGNGASARSTRPSSSFVAAITQRMGSPTE